MSSADDVTIVISQVRRYQKRLETCDNDVTIILKTLKKLNNLPMSLQILKDTRVGRSVNSMKTISQCRPLAEEIVRKWKLLVPESSSDKKKKKTNNNAPSGEYHPSGNWQMTSKEESSQHLSKKKSKKRSEYEPAKSIKSYEDEAISPEYESYTPTGGNKSNQTLYQPSSSSNGSSNKYKPSSKTSKEYTPSNNQREEYKPSSNNNQREEYKPSKSYQPSNKSTTSYQPSAKSSTSYRRRGDSPLEYDPQQGSPTNNEYSPYRPSSSSHLYPISESDDDVTRDADVTHDADELMQRYSPDQLDSIVEEYSPRGDGASSGSAAASAYLPGKKKKHKSPPLECAREKQRGERTGKRKSGGGEVLSGRGEDRKKTTNTTTTKQTNNKKKSAVPSFEDFMAAPVVKKKKKKTAKPASSAPSIMTSQKATKSLKTSSSSSSKSPGIKLDLPEIEKIYRPLHHAPLKRRPPPPPQEEGSGGLTDDMAAALHTQRNTGRMQIYSGGGKSNIVPAVYSLRDICIDYLRNNIDRLERINIPYYIIEPILEKCNPDQLHKIESFNEELVDDTHSMWEKHTKVEFKGKTPQDMQSWRELYWELRHQRDQKLEYLKSKIKSKTDKQKPLEKRTKMAFVGIGEAKAPRNVQRAQIRNGTGNAKHLRNMTSSSSSASASTIKNAASVIRMSVPVGRITASTVTSSSSTMRQRSTKKPGKAPLMARTLKSIGKLRR